MQPEVTFKEITPGNLSLNDDRYFHFLRYVNINFRLYQIV